MNADFFANCTSAPTHLNWIDTNTSYFQSNDYTNIKHRCRIVRWKENLPHLCPLLFTKIRKTKEKWIKRGNCKRFGCIRQMKSILCIGKRKTTCHHFIFNNLNGLHHRANNCRRQMSTQMTIHRLHLSLSVVAHKWNNLSRYLYFLYK